MNFLKHKLKVLHRGHTFTSFYIHMVQWYEKKKTYTQKRKKMKLKVEQQLQDLVNLCLERIERLGAWVQITVEAIRSQHLYFNNNIIDNINKYIKIHNHKFINNIKINNIITS